MHLGSAEVVAKRTREAAARRDAAQRVKVSLRDPMSKQKMVKHKYTQAMMGDKYWYNRISTFWKIAHKLSACGRVEM